MSDDDPFIEDALPEDPSAQADGGPPPINGDGVGAAIGTDAASAALEEQREKYLRLAAEYDNFRRRTAKERQEAHLPRQADMLKGPTHPLAPLSRSPPLHPPTPPSPPTP